MRFLPWLFSIFYLVIIVSLPCKAESLGIDTVKVGTVNDSIWILNNQQLWIFCDSTHKMTYQEVQQLPITDFKSTKSGLSNLEELHFNYYWFKFFISNISKEKEARLMINSNRFDLFDLYQKNKSQIDTLKGGRLLNIQERILPNDGRHIPIVIPPNTTIEIIGNPKTFYDVYEVYSIIIKSLNIYNHEKQQVFLINYKYHIFQGFFYGFLTFIMIFSVLQSFFEKDKVYLYYAIYIFSIILYYCLGGVVNMITPFSFLSGYYHSFKLTLSFFIFFIYILFFVEFIYVKNDSNPLPVKVLIIAAKILAIIFILDLLLRISLNIVFYKNFYDNLRYVLLGLSIIVTLAMIKSMRKDKFAKYIISGTLLLLFFGLINFPLYMKKPGLIKGGMSYTQIGILLEILFFSIGLSLRSRQRIKTAQTKEFSSNQQLQKEKLANLNIQKDKAQLQQQLAETELKALKAQLNPHFISNSLNAVKQLVQSGEQIKASDYLADFSTLIRTILNNSEEKLIPIQQELDYCQQYLALESLRFGNSFSYSIEIDKNIDTTYVKIPPLLLQPYLENAIWHGLLPKSDNRHLDIKVKNKKGFIICIIEDNGIGRKASIEKKQKLDSSKKSYGLAITHERIAVNNQLYEVGLSVKIIDKEDGFGNALGTSVELKIPI